MQKTFPAAGSVVVRGTPILIYQVGKVGSQTIRESLRKLDLPDSIHHIHNLSAAKISEQSASLARLGLPDSRQLEQSRVVREFLDQQSNPKLKIISAVREPVSQRCSAVFQNLKRCLPNRSSHEGVVLGKGVSAQQPKTSTARLSRTAALNW